VPEGQVYRCQNRDCGCEISVVKLATESHCNPRCLCGAEMKKPYSRPLLRNLDANFSLFICLENRQK
jgi:predicted nucleic acid-binding Zn ribbon protein